MKKVVCIFAHPDDESFGPSGTIALLSKTNEVYIICATQGDAGENPQNRQDLGQIRASEAQESAKILGVKDVFFLDYRDGTLCNKLYHDLASKIEKIVGKIKPDTLLTFEPRGISGHIDHITISMVTSFIFEKTPSIKKIMYHCISSERRAKIKDYFIYFPEGYDRSQIHEVVNIERVWDLKERAIKAHVSQSHDGKRILSQLKDLPREEYFLTRQK